MLGGGALVHSVREPQFERRHSSFVSFPYSRCTLAVTLVSKSMMNRRAQSATLTGRRAWANLRVGLLLLFVFAVLDTADVFEGERWEPGSEVPRVRATVSRVIDGDTIVVALDGGTYVVRYLGIDAPETVRPDWPVEPLGPEASALNEKLVGGKTIWLESDVSEADQFGRLLRWVWLEDGRLVNAVLVEEGYARAVALPPNLKHADVVVRLQGEARANERGLWARR